METRKFVILMVLVGMALALAAGVGVVLAQGPEPQAALGTAFTYQGQLEKGGNSVNGDCDMAFRLYDDGSAGSQVGSAISTTVPVTDGLFTVELDFGGSAFQGDVRWLGVKVKGPSDSIYTDLGRQELTAIPYAFYSLSTAQIPEACSDGQVVKWNDTGSFWECSDDSDTTYTDGNQLNLTGSTFNVVEGTGSGLDADLLDGQHGSYYRNADNINAGTLNTGHFSAYSDLSAESKIGTGSSQVAAGDHNHFGQQWSGSGSYGLMVENSSSTGVMGVTWSTSGLGLYGYASALSGTNYGVYGRTRSGGGYGGLFVNDGSGTRYLLAADDDTTISDLKFKVDNDGNVYADGTYYGAGGVTAGSADFAEMMLPGQADLVPGDVLAIGADGRMVRSTEAYQSTIVGVYSTQPGIVAGHKWDEDGNPLEPERIPLAVLGVVPVKASGENGSIQPGDLLAASSTPGHAMKAGSNPPIGTVIGKALEGLETGTGVIQMLVMLQ